MNADDIEKNIRERIAEIDAQIAPLLKERAKLQAMLKPELSWPLPLPTPTWIPVPDIVPQPLPYVPWYVRTLPNTGTPMQPLVFDATSPFPFEVYTGYTTLRPSDDLVYGPGPSVDSSMVFKA